MFRLGILSKTGYRFIKNNQNQKQYIKYGTATNIPVKSNYADVVYSCHMMEHLTYSNAELFLEEVKRVLKIGGTFRLVIPDFDIYINKYLENKNADDFLKKTYLTIDVSNLNIRSKIRYSIYGKGIDHHEYMYNSVSVQKLLETHGFKDIKILKAGESTLPDIDGLDLSTRSVDSMYIECIK